MTTGTAEERTARQRPALRELLLRPFGYVAGAHSLGLGLAAILAAGFLGSLSNTHFDGVLDMHTGPAARPALVLGAGIVNWVSLSVVLWLMGKLVSRKAKSRKYAESLPGAPDGKYVVIQFDTVFENKASAVETVTPMVDPDGSWRVSGYYVR